MRNNTFTPTYLPEFWEAWYDIELKPFLALIKKKALRIKYLEKTDLHSIPETQAKNICRQIQYLSNELEVLYGVKLTMDELKNSYLKSSQAIYEEFHNENLTLKIELYQLKQTPNSISNQFKPTNK